MHLHALYTIYDTHTCLRHWWSEGPGPALLLDDLHNVRMQLNQQWPHRLVAFHR